MRYLIHPSLCLLWCLSCSSGSLPTDELDAVPPEQVRLLLAEPFEQRLERVKRLRQGKTAAEKGRAILSLRPYIVYDRSEVIRTEAVDGLYFGLHHPDDPCPDELIAALLDPNEYFVQSVAMGVDVFKTFDPASIPLLLRCLQSNNAVARNSAVNAFNRLRSADPAILNALEKATHDPLTKFNAHAAIYQITKENRPLLHAWFFMLAKDLGPTPPASARLERALWQAESISAFFAVEAFASNGLEDHPKEVLRIVREAVNDPNPTIRRGVAGLIRGVMKRAVEGSADLDNPAPELARPAKAMLAAYRTLRDNNLPDLLRQRLEVETDSSVREMIQSTLAVWKEDLK